MEQTLWDPLYKALKNLDEAGFKRFCIKLCDSQEGDSTIPKHKLENASREDVVGLIHGTFSYPRGIEVAVSILNDINEGDVAGHLMESLRKGKEHFVDRHCEDLIKQVYVLKPVLDDLLKYNLLTQEQYDSICSKTTDQEQMRALYAYVTDWSDGGKDTLYVILQMYNPSLISHLNRQDRGWYPTLSSWKYRDVLQRLSEASTSGLSSDPKPGSSKDPKPPTGGKADTEMSEQSTTSSTALCSESLQSREDVLMTLHEVDCDLCGKDHEPDDTLVAPNINGKTYRLELQSAGLFRCSETGIKFRVNQPVTIEYELDSWYNYMEFLRHQGSEVLGPLFNIKTPQEAHIVSAVYLPHYLCLKELNKDTSWISIAHFKDGNLSVEKPTRILPFHVVLENPSFSTLGVFFWRVLPTALTKHIPIHGKILLYFRVIGQTCMEYQLHLYMMPCFVPINQEFEKQKTDTLFVKVDKPSMVRRPIYTEKNYIVNGPEGAYIEPKELEVRCISPLENFTDITIDAPVEEMYLNLVQKYSTHEVWACRMSRGQIEHLCFLSDKSKIPKADIQNLIKEKDEIKQNKSSQKRFVRVHFVIKHRKALIDRLPMIEPILDELHSQNILTDEAYDTVFKENTTQMKVRRLFKFVRSWGTREMDVFLEALRKHQGPLIDDLARTSSEESED